MSKIHGMMDVGKRSMMNSQTALQTVGHNIANKSTEGYSRQRVELQTNEPIGQGKLRIGMGAKTALVTRINNPYLEKQIGKEQSSLGYHEGKYDAMMRVEQVFNEQGSRGLNGYINDFFNAFREFSNNPESLATRTQVKETADSLAKDFRRVHGHLVEVTKDLDQQISTRVSEINEITREIANLNQKIQTVQIAGGPANDERDRRDLLIKNLGERVNVRWAEGTDGMVTITAGSSALLVAGYDAKALEVQATPETETKGEGNYDIYFKNTEDSVPVKITDQINGGSIGGLLEVRDVTIIDAMKDIDGLAYGLGSVVNEVHSRGYDALNRKGGDFFKLPQQLRHAAEHMFVDDKILRDPNRIAAGMSMDSPGDNRIASAISQLQYERVMGRGSSTFDEHYNSVVGKVGILTKRAESSDEAQKNIVKQLSNIRESISGVSLDEETTKLIEFQKAFDASARLIRTADEMFDTVLGLKRL